MSSIRGYMGDRRVAAALAAVALLAVGYRLIPLYGISPGPADPAVEAPAPAAAGTAPVSAREARPLPPPPVGMPSAGSGPAWKWDRNPFLSPSRERAGGAGDTAEGTSPGPSVPVLRGTIAGGSGGSAIFRGDRADGRDVLVSLGGTIDGWTLAAVEPYRVFLRRGKDRRTLELYRP